MSSERFRSKGWCSSTMAGSSHSVHSLARDGWALNMAMPSAATSPAAVRSGPPPGGAVTEGDTAWA